MESIFLFKNKIFEGPFSIDEISDIYLKKEINDSTLCGFERNGNTFPLYELMLNYKPQKFIVFKNSFKSNIEETVVGDLFYFDTGWIFCGYDTIPKKITSFALGAIGKLITSVMDNLDFKEIVENNELRRKVEFGCTPLERINKSDALDVCQFEKIISVSISENQVTIKEKQEITNYYITDNLMLEKYKKEILSNENIRNEDQISEFGLGTGFGSLKILLKKISLGVWRNYYSENFLSGIFKNNEIRDQMSFVYDSLVTTQFNKYNFSEVKFIKQLSDCPKEFVNHISLIITESFKSRKSSGNKNLFWFSSIIILLLSSLLFVKNSTFQVIVIILVSLIFLVFLQFSQEYIKYKFAVLQFSKVVKN